MVGVGYHHPSVQWPCTPLDERYWGNPAAAACQAGLGLPGICALLTPTPRSLISLVVKAAGYNMHARIRPLSQRRHLAIIACVDSLCAIRTMYVSDSSLMCLILVVCV